MQILLLIVWIYLSMMFTLFFVFIKRNDVNMEIEKKKIYKDNDRREEKLNKILHLSYKIDTKTYLNNKKLWKKKN